MAQVNEGKVRREVEPWEIDPRPVIAADPSKHLGRPDGLGHPFRHPTQGELLMIRQLRAIMCTYDEICVALKVAKATLVRWKKDYSEVYEALEAGALLGAISVRRMLFRHAQAHYQCAIFLSKNIKEIGYRDVTDWRIGGDKDAPLTMKLLDAIVNDRPLPDDTESLPEFSERSPAEEAVASDPGSDATGDEAVHPGPDPIR